MNVAVLAAHPDDAELAMGGTIALPIYPELTEAQLRHVAETLVETVRRLA